MILFEGRPGDRRGFVHKKLLSFGSKALGLLPIPGARIASGILGGFTGGRSRRGGLVGTQGTGVWTNRATGQSQRGVPGPKPRAGLDIDWSFVPDRSGGLAPVRPTLPRSITARPTVFSEAGKQLGRGIKFADLPQSLNVPRIPERIRRHLPPVLSGLFDGNGGNGGNGDCPGDLVQGPLGLCLEPTSPLGASRLGGEAIMGQYGAAMVPGSRIVDRATCLPGMQLGNDGLCYNKSQISNKQRMWPAGRKPLLTGGDMRAISIAARAGRRMDLATKRMQKLGMMKKPAARRRAPAGHRAHLHHEGSEH